MTCFGGGRETGEAPEAALLRELSEELGWRPPSWTMACDLLGRNGRWIARFWTCPYDGGALTCEPDTVAVWAPRAALPGLPLSPWHRAVLAAVADGRKAVDAPG